MMFGSTPATPHWTIFARGSRPRPLAQSPSTTISAAAPSQIPLALPAVTTPSFLKTGGSLARVSIVVCGRGCSSVSTVFGPLRVFTSTGAISSAKKPPSCAAAHFCCERTPKASESSRLMSYFSARFSAVTAIGVLQ